FDPVDLRATFLANTSGTTFALAGSALGFPASIAAYGLTSLAAPIFGDLQPTDLRSVAWDTTPKYDAEESIFLLNFRHDFETMTLRVNGGMGNSKIQTSMDFDGGVGPVLTRPASICGAGGPFGPLGGVCALTGGAAGPATFPVSAFDVGITSDNNGLVGVIGGLEQARSNNYQSIDMSIGEEDYWSVESIINSDFDGAFNFLFGANHIQSNGFADYAVATTGLDYFAYTFGTIVATGLGAPGAPGVAYSFYVPYFWNDTDDNHLNSTSLFGEIYVDITDNLKLTGGVRHNWDTKSLRDRGSILESSSSTNPGILAGAPPIVPIGTPSVRPLLDADELTEGTPGAVNDFRVIESDFDSTTGRAVLQWTPSDNAQLYFSWTRGFKSGGFNPRTLTAGVPLTFAPEVINAYEAGIKTNLGNLQANLTGFYYDYSGLQVSRIVANTSVNENIDATIWGLEGEFVWQPTDRWTFNMNASYLNTRLGEFSTVDVRNPTAGRTDVDLFADITTGQNCVITRNAGAPALIGTVLGGPFAPLNPLIASPFSVCSQLA
ncbi:MAG: TonB-dependent receptor, partial [Parvularculaceae bacterium]